MIGQTANLADFRLPAACVDLAAHLEGQFGVPSHLLLACFPLALGVAANTCRLDTSIWPEPINAGLDLVFGGENQKGFRLAVDYILAPVVKVLSKNAKFAVDLRSRNADGREQEILIVGNRHRERATPSEAPISEPARPRALVVANLRLGQLQRVTHQHPDGLTLAVYDDGPFVELIEKAKSRAERDLMSLRSGWGRPPETLPLAGTVESRVQPVVSCLGVCSGSTLARFVGSKKALVRQLVEQFLVLAETSPVEIQTGWVRQDRSFDTWSDLYVRVADACSSAGNLLIGMTVESGKLLLEYLLEEIKANPVRCWAELGPLIAAKLALCFHLCLVGPKSQVSAEVMRDAIGMARWLVRTSAQAKTVLAELNLRRHAQRLLARIPKDGPIGWRELCRRFNPQGTAIHQPVSEAAVRAAVAEDYNLLLHEAEASRWADNTPLQVTLFGPLWPEGEPDWTQRKNPIEEPAQSVFQDQEQTGRRLPIRVSPGARLRIKVSPRVTAEELGQLLVALSRLHRNLTGEEPKLERITIGDQSDVTEHTTV